MHDIFFIPVYTSSPTPALFKHERYNIQRHEGLIAAAPFLLPGVGYQRWINTSDYSGLVYRAPPLLNLPPLLIHSGLLLPGVRNPEGFKATGAGAKEA